MSPPRGPFHLIETKGVCLRCSFGNRLSSKSRKTESCRWERTVVDVSIASLTNVEPNLFVKYFDCGVDLGVVPTMSSTARHCSRIIPRGLIPPVQANDRSRNHVAFFRSVTVPTLAASATVPTLAAPATWATLLASAASIVERRMPRPEQTALLQAQSGR